MQQLYADSELLISLGTNYNYSAGDDHTLQFWFYTGFTTTKEIDLKHWEESIGESHVYWTMQVACSNNPPTSPTIGSTPTQATLDATTNISVTVGTDADSDQVKVQCSATNSNYASTPYDSGLGSGGRSVNVPFVFSQLGTQTIECTSYDEHGANSTTASRPIQVVSQITEYTLTVYNDPAAGGTITGNGVNCAAASCQYTYASGTNLLLAATPNTGYQLTSWDNCDSVDGSSRCVVTMSGNKSIVAHYVAQNNPPVLYIDSAPTMVLVGQPYKIRVHATDPDNNLSHINVNWGGGNIPRQDVTNGQVVEFSTTYTTTGVKTWSATAYDAYDTPSSTYNGSVTVVPKTGLQAKPYVKQQVSIYQTSPGTRCRTDCCQSLTGDPIDTATGAQVLELPMLTVQGVIPISFNLVYNSLVLDEDTVGKGWGHNFGYQARLNVLTDGSIEVQWASNRANLFTPQGGGVYTSTELASKYDRLVKNADNSYTLTLPENFVYQFNSAGRLIEQKNPKGQRLTFSYDASNRLSQITEPVSGVYLRYAYNGQGLLATVTDPLNRQVQLGYDANRNLISITNAAGQTATYTYNAQGQVLTGTDAEGRRFFTNTYDAQGRVSTQDDGRADNQIVQISYDETTLPGQVITTVTNRLGQTRIYTYNASYQLLSIRGELGNLIAVYTYDAQGNRISSTDANNASTQFSYDSAGNILSMTDPTGQTTSWTYDSRHNLLSEENAMGKETLFTYDASNNLLTATDALNNVTSYTYNANGQVVTSTSPKGYVTIYTYTSGRVTRVMSPEGSFRRFTYDAAGRLITSADADSNTTTYTYDAACGSTCRMNTVTDPLGHTVQMTYDSRGNLLQVTDAKSQITSYTYDANGNRLSLTDALTNQTSYLYDGEDRLVKITNARNYATQFAYDALGRLITITDALGNTRQMTYDNTTRVLTEVDAYGKTIVTRAYNAAGDLVSVKDALNNTVLFTYDALHRLQQATDPLSRVTNLSYDDLNRMISATDANTGVSSQSFDADGNRVTLKDPNNNQTGLAFDQNGRLTSETSAAAGILRYTYNARDLLQQAINARGQQRQFTYDNAGRLSGATDPNGTIGYTYDNNDNVLTVTDATGTITRGYDALNRVTSYTDSQGNVIQYAYDQVGNLTTLTYPGGKQVRYTYDAVNRLSTVTDWNNRVTTYTYDNNDRLIRVNRPNDTILTRTYNDAGQLLQQKDVTAANAVIVQYDFTYDAAGNITAEQMTPEPDPFPLDSATMTYSAANRLATYNGQTVTHDADGNMTRGPLQGALADFQFDSRNRLTQAGTTIYTYNAENQRIAVTENGQPTRYVINPNTALSQILITTDPNGTQTFYVYGLGLIGQEQSGNYLTYHFDLRGSTTALTNTTGAILDRFAYSPYGLLVNHIGVTATPFLYNGRDGVMTDSNGLYYMRARYYNPDVRRFVNQDILIGNVQEAQSLNRYVYVGDNPLARIDPNGMYWFQSQIEWTLNNAIVPFAQGSVNAIKDSYAYPQKKLEKGDYLKASSGVVLPTLSIPFNSLWGGAVGVYDYHTKKTSQSEALKYVVKTVIDYPNDPGMPDIVYDVADLADILAGDEPQNKDMNCLMIETTFAWVKCIGAATSHIVRQELANKFPSLRPSPPTGECFNEGREAIIWDTCLAKTLRQ